jgi:broad specificity phosphatase PhoE
VETVVHVVRHGEVHNPSKILYGRLPGFVLSPRGQAMADRVADALASHDVTAVIASPLERAQQTAAPIAARHGVPVGTDDRIIEADNIFEGQRVSVGDGALRKPAAWRHLWNPVRPSWGEPYTEIAARMSRAIEDARAANAGHEVVLVSHQLPVWIARLAAEGRRLWHNPTSRQCSLASVTSLTFDGVRLAAITYTEPARDLLTSDDLTARGA